MKVLRPIHKNTIIFKSFLRRNASVAHLELEKLLPEIKTRKFESIQEKDFISELFPSSRIALAELKKEDTVGWQTHITGTKN